MRPSPNPGTPRYTDRASGLLCPAARPRARLRRPFTHYSGPMLPNFRFIIIALAILTDTLSAYYAPDTLIFGPIKDGLRGLP